MIFKDKFPMIYEILFQWEEFAYWEDNTELPSNLELLSDFINIENSLTTKIKTNQILLNDFCNRRINRFEKGISEVTEVLEEPLKYRECLEYEFKLVPWINDVFYSKKFIGSNYSSIEQEYIKFLELLLSVLKEGIEKVNNIKKLLDRYKNDDCQDFFKWSKDDITNFKKNFTKKI